MTDDNKNFDTARFNGDGSCDIVAVDGSALRITEAETEWVYRTFMSFADDVGKSQIVREPDGQLCVHAHHIDDSIVTYKCDDEEADE